MIVVGFHVRCTVPWFWWMIEYSGHMLGPPSTISESFLLNRPLLFVLMIMRSTRTLFQWPSYWYSILEVIFLYLLIRIMIRIYHNFDYYYPHLHPRRSQHPPHHHHQDATSFQVPWSISWSFWCQSFSEKRSGVGWKDREPKDIFCENSNSWYPEAHIPWLHKEVKCLWPMFCVPPQAVVGDARSRWNTSDDLLFINTLNSWNVLFTCTKGVCDLFLVQQRSFLKLCKDTGLLNDSFTAVDADLIFAKAVDGSMEGISSSLLKNCVGESNQRPHIKWENERYITSL